MKTFGIYIVLLTLLLVVSCKDKEKQESILDATEVVQEELVIEENPYKNAYFGELHLHTSWSIDAFGFGNQVVGPEEAYRFAKGEEVPLPGGGTTKITQPLDFASVTEHTEWLGEIYMITNKDHPRYNYQFAKDAREANENFFKTILAAENAGVRPDFSGENGELAAEYSKTVWQEIYAITEKHNEPGIFTTLHGFEWTAAPEANNMHRNIIFRGNKVPDVPVSWFEARTVEKLWDWLESTGGGEANVLAIPHNSNMSGGLMFKPEYSDGSLMDKAYAERRSRNEPLFEMIQAKGNSETHPRFSPNDEFANFELIPLVNFSGPVTNSPNMWVRQALKNGLKLENELGVNPFNFGFVGGTDQHNGLMGDTDEFDFNGSHGFGDGTPKVRLTENLEVFNLTALNPGGLTGVWAEANTRENIWDALRNKETFATSGTRIKVRFFASYDYKEGMENSPDFIQIAYQKGVPMGSDLKASNGKVPNFLVWALKDPMSGNLDRIQIVKGWLDGDGNLKEKVYDVAWSDNRKLDANNSLPDLGSTVDITTATYENTIGAVEISGYWSDPDFDPNEKAFYYVRVIEIPTPRWSTYESVKSGIPLDKDVPKTIQERAWSSPIWYSPN